MKSLYVPLLRSYKRSDCDSTGMAMVVAHQFLHRLFEFLDIDIVTLALLNVLALLDLSRSRATSDSGTYHLSALSKLWFDRC